MISRVVIRIALLSGALKINLMESPNYYLHALHSPAQNILTGKWLLTFAQDKLAGKLKPAAYIRFTYIIVRGR
jgi:hypothetical protein